jgi:hypothetical protein
MLLFLGLGLGLVLCGCSRHGGKPAVMTSNTFDSAPPELKQKWQEAGKYAAARNYLGAVTNLVVILSSSQQLSPEQNAAANEAWMDIGNQAFEAGDKGDKSAVQAVLEMRNSGFGKTRNER